MNSLFQHAKKCFLVANPDEKIALTYQVQGQWQANQLLWQEGERVETLNVPGSLAQPEVVMPKDLPKRNSRSEIGRAALIHSLTHIELTAVNLAWDTIYRYRGMPKEYYDDWVQCAAEEAGHFILLREHLRKQGFDYGSFPVHNELWKMAVRTGDCCLTR